MPRHWLSLLTLITLTFVFVVLWESPPEHFLRPPHAIDKLAQYPSSYLSGVAVTQYDEHGAVSYQFDADRLEHFQASPQQQSKQDFTDIKAPYLILYDAENPPWYIRAKKGKAREEGRNILLEENVRAWQSRDGEQISELTTSKLELEPDTQYAQTDKPVMINFPDSETRAIGMQADFKQDRIELLSRVRGVHEPVQNRP